ncbi:MAG TPA: 4-(cytidine 5'-diphospho)-2-C-methyl-D-erythritol kinase [Candidatus Limnocylindria bacterium]|nr:4-(cytidine 5'-diphospho)-2-C-methyl-D-erythritol kinase [Candidatus Limnocylindria bacterium]
MRVQRSSPCKVNLLLNILGKRPDGFHELETLFFPVPLHDEIIAEAVPDGLVLTCSNPALPCDGTNLVHRAAAKFLEAAAIGSGVRLHLEKRLPLAAGLGAGSANAAVTLLALNEVFGQPLTLARLDALAATLGSDVNFFLQPNPALAGGRGERITPLEPFPMLRGCAMFLFHPGFGVATPWAFRELARFPEALNGRAGRAAEVAEVFRQGDRLAAGAALYNSLEAPVLGKYPILRLYQEFLRAHGAFGTLMSGSGSTTFALFPDTASAEAAVKPFRAKFGETGWLQVVPL